MAFGKFYHHHYEKILLVFFLILFALLLVWQVSVIQDAQNKEVNQIVNRRDGSSNYKSSYDFNSETYSIDKVFGHDQSWLSAHLKSDKVDSLSTDLFTSYKLARCVHCYKYIPASCFPKKGMKENGKCPFCNGTLVPKRYEDVDAGDRNGNGIPDEVELSHGFSLDDPYAVEQDTDNDGFTFREEFLGKTNPDDAASHPPLAAKLSVVQVFNGKLKNAVLKRIGFPDNLEDFASYEFFFKITVVKDKKKTNHSITAKYKVPFTVEDDSTYEVVEIRKPDSAETKVLKRDTVVVVKRDDKDTIEFKVDKLADDPKETAYIYNSLTGQYSQHKVGDTITVKSLNQGEESFKITSMSVVNSTVSVVSEKDESVKFVIQKKSMNQDSEQYGGMGGGRMPMMRGM